MRYALTIAYNALHHLKHNDYYKTILDNFDKWAIIEGFSHNGGSSSWCNNISMAPQSKDGTIEFCEQLVKDYPDKVIFQTSETGWASKDQQSNKGIELLKGLPEGWLWNIDADEQWASEDFALAESMLEKSIETAGAFKFIHYLCKDAEGNQLIGGGNWGDNVVDRLWWFKGQKFLRHVGPVMEGQKGRKLLPIKYHHYSYYFQQDVEFKSKYYRGYEPILNNWKKIQTKKYKYPISVTELLGNRTSVDVKNSYITKL